MILASVYRFACTKESERNRSLKEVESVLEQSCQNGMPLFANSEADENASVASLLSVFNRKDKNVLLLFEALVVLLDAESDRVAHDSVWKKWRLLKDVVLDLPVAETEISIELGDARFLPLRDKSVDFVLTSPPYINVFNYHHNYRRSVELLGWDVLHSAKSEIGANRKFRQNRVLTVIQYSIDMTIALAELCRVVKDSGRIVYVVGRESNVHKTALYNGRILSSLASQVLKMEVVAKQERKFSNKYGQLIREDVLHLKPTNRALDRAEIVNGARELARDVLLEARTRAPFDRIEYFDDALERIQQVEASPRFVPLEK